MLENTLTLNFSVDGTSAAVDVVFEKTANESENSTYKETSTVDDPSKPAHFIFFEPTAPKQTKSSYGVRREVVKVRREYMVATPLGVDVKTPALMTVNFSIPATLPLTDVDSFLDECGALFGTDIFKRAVKRQET